MKEEILQYTYFIINFHFDYFIFFISLVDKESIPFLNEPTPLECIFLNLY